MPRRRRRPIVLLLTRLSTAEPLCPVVPARRRSAVPSQLHVAGVVLFPLLLGWMHCMILMRIQ